MKPYFCNSEQMYNNNYSNINNYNNNKGKPVRGYRQRMSGEWRDRGLSESTEQRVCYQARTIRKNGWLSQLELEAIKRQVENEFQGELGEDSPTEVEK